MSVLFNGAVSGSSIDTGDIGHSLRCRRSATANLTKTFGSPTSQNSWAWSAWVKPTINADGTHYQPLLTAGTTVSGGHPGEEFWFDANGEFRYGSSTSLGTNNITKISTRRFRDPTAWLHVFVRKTAAANSGLTCIRFWINNEEITSWATNAYTGTQASVPDYINVNATAHAFGRSFLAEYFDGYLARKAFVDNGGSLLPTDFGYFNTEINEWVSKSQSAVKAVVDAGGTNSTMLDFDNGTSLTTLGYDKSSKGNNWTLNNFSLTAGTSYDWMLDVPGNSFATLNPLIPSAANISNGNLTSGTTAVRGTQKALDFDSKWEVSAGGSAVTAGTISSTGTTNTTSVTANKTFAFRLTTAGALDYRNVTDAGAWTSITTGLTGEQYPYGTAQAANWNFGQAPLHASATYDSSAGGYFFDTTSGYKALCQRNLPDPAILNPEKHFDVVTYTGSSATKSITGLLFQPDLSWVKSRNTTWWHVIQDSVRGVTKAIYSNSTNAESSPGGVTSFNSDGVTFDSYNNVNNLNDTYVDWLWKAGGAAVTNNAGSISSQVSANVTAGFSIVTYTGTGANATVGHGLGKAPGLVITKDRTAASTNNWAVYNAALANTEYLLLNTTAAKTTGATYWNSSTPSSTVFSVGTANDTNQSAHTYVAYCFAEIAGYSKIGSYTGNGSTDGPFVACGFKPRFILVKCSSIVESWYIFDTARGTYNVIGPYLVANTSVVEATYSGIDVTAFGFKVRDSNNWLNGAAQTYIFYAVADVADKYSLGR